MAIHPLTHKIIDNVFIGKAPDYHECLHLLDLNPISYEASLIRATADWLTRKRFDNQAILLGQIGIESGPCPGDCQFCHFGVTHYPAEHKKMPMDEIITHAVSFTSTGDLFALFLMAMHDFDFDFLLETISKLRGIIPSATRLVVNIGDIDSYQANLLAKTGVSGAYHVRRLREGIDSGLDPEDRVETIEAIRKVGMDWYYCCEPIGPEHTAQEIADQMFLGIELGCFQHAAMRRVPVPGTPLASKGQISELRLAQIVAVITLVSLACPETKTIAVHEPNSLGLVSGANTIYAESGINPRDQKQRTEEGRGLDLLRCHQMLLETGFSELLLGDGTSKPIINATN